MARNIYNNNRNSTSIGITNLVNQPKHGFSFLFLFHGFQWVKPLEAQAEKMRKESLLVFGIIFFLLVSIASANILDVFAKIITTVEVTTNPNIVLWLPFDEGSACTANDLSQYDNDGTLKPNCSYNSPTWTPGKIGNALDFDGVDDYVSIPNNTIFDFGSGGFTVEAWIKTGSTSRQWVATGYEYYGPGWGLGTQDAKVLGYIRTLESGSGKLEILGTTDITDDWHHIALVRVDDNIEVYFDGSKENNGTLVGNVNNDEPIEIGRISYAGGSQYFNGIIDNPRVWNIALTQEQIRSIYESDG